MENLWNECTWGHPSILVKESTLWNELMSSYSDKEVDRYCRIIQSSVWSVEEISIRLLQDVHDWNDKLTPLQRRLLACVLAFFKVGDDEVNGNIVLNFMSEMPTPELVEFYANQMAQESVHSRTYKLLFKHLILENREQEGGGGSLLTTFNEEELQKLTKTKSDWMTKYLGKGGCGKFFPIKLICMAITEGGFFSAAFVLIRWLETKNIMPSLTLSNGFISRDEALHFEFTVFLFHKLYQADTENRVEWKEFLHSQFVQNMFIEAYEVEKAFWTNAFDSQNDITEDFTLDKVLDYIRFVFRGICLSLFIPVPEIFVGYVKNPFKFMHLINMTSRTNFFEKTSTEYSLHGIFNEVAVNSIKDIVLPTKIKKPKMSEDFCSSSSNGGVNKELLIFFEKLIDPIISKNSVGNSLFDEKFMEFVYKLSCSDVLPPLMGGLKDAWLNAAHECSLLSIFDYRFSYLAAMMLNEGNCGSQECFNASQYLIESVFQSYTKSAHAEEEGESEVKMCENQEQYFECLELQKSPAPQSFLECHECYDGRTLNRSAYKIISESLGTYQFPVRLLSYLGAKTLQESYLLKEKLPSKNGDLPIYEDVRHFYLRIAQSAGMNFEEVIKIMYGLCLQKFIFGSSILFNAGRSKMTISNCYLLYCGDSIEEIMETVGEMAVLSKSTGGIGVHLNDIRANGSPINCGQNKSSGILPLMQMINSQSYYINQGGKRQGSIAVYLEPWHADVIDFLRCRLGNAGAEEGGRCRNLFTALWMCDLFYERLRKDPQSNWSLFDPAADPKCRRLVRTWGTQFEETYLECERLGLAKTTVTCQFLWDAIIRSLMETGTPYLMSKDACNELSQHREWGTIRGSNLCAEIVEMADKKNTAVCTLASINLVQFKTQICRAWDIGKYMDVCLADRFIGEQEALKPFYETVQTIVFALNHLLKKNVAPSVRAQESLDKYLALGIGVQGFAYLLQLLRVPFESKDCEYINAMIFEHLYFAAVQASYRYQRDVDPSPKEWFSKSPAKVALLQPYLWEERQKRLGRRRCIKPELEYLNENADDDTERFGRVQYSTFFNHPQFTFLRHQISYYGMANSLLIALMPTASTSQILDNSESFEPLHSNLFKKQTLTGDNVVVNRILQQHLQELALWDESMAQRIEMGGGSIQHITEIPEDVREIYKTAWEINPRQLTKLAAQREMYIDQSQSRNVYLSGYSAEEVGNELLYAQELDLKTVVYYLRTRPAHQAIAWSNPQWHETLLKSTTAVCNRENKECTSCSG